MTERCAHDARTHDANIAPHLHTNIVTAAPRPLDVYLSARAAAEPRVRRTKPLVPTLLRSRCTPVHSKWAETRPRVAHRASFGVDNDNKPGYPIVPIGSFTMSSEGRNGDSVKILGFWHFFCEPESPESSPRIFLSGLYVLHSQWG